MFSVQTHTYYALDGSLFVPDGTFYAPTSALLVSGGTFYAPVGSIRPIGNHLEDKMLPRNQ